MPDIIQPLPMIVPVFQQDGAVIQYKRFPRDYMWRPLFDFSDIIASEISASLEAALIDIGEGINNAQNAANQANNDISAINAKLALIAEFSWFADEMQWTVGIPARSITGAVPYNWCTYTLTLSANAIKTFYCTAGTYEVRILLPKGSNYGKVDIAIDGAGIAAGYDLYSAANDFANELVVQNVTLNGFSHGLTITCVGKNAASTGYAMTLVKFWGRKTA